MDRPNILLLTVDTLRADHVGCYGYDAPITPNIDRLAESAVRFEQAITGGSWTQAAFPVLFTSTYASMYGGCLGPLSPLRPSPIEALAEEGYLTAGFTTSPLLGRKYGYNRGFKFFSELVPDESDPFLRRVKGGQRLLRSSLTHHLSGLIGISTRPARLYVSGEELTDAVCWWLDEAKSPFFVWAHYMDIHWPYHREETLRHPAEIARAWRNLGHMHGANWNGLTFSSDQRAEYMRLYDGAVQYTDAQIGRLLNYLERKGHINNTVIILVSDHGEEFLERQQWGHFETNLYDEILKVPLLIYDPQFKEGRKIHNQVRTLDIMPTVLDLCACPPPDSMEGASLVPFWNPIHHEYDSDLSISEMWRDERHIVAVRTDRYKYIWDSHHPEKRELYDLWVDRAECNNVADRNIQKTSYFQAVVDAHLARAEMQKGDYFIDEPERDEALIRRLRDLGYVE